MQNLQCVAGDVGNTFLTSYTTEKIFVIDRPEFGPDLESKCMLLVQSIYGIRSAAARFHKSLSAKLCHINFRPSGDDPDLWFRRLKDGSYEYIARYVDDVMCFFQESN